MSPIAIADASVWVEDGRFEPRTVWIRDGRIAAVGARHDAAAAGSHEDVRVLSFPRGFVLPAFVDAHFHLLGFATRSLRCDLSTARGGRDVVEALARHAAAHPGDGPVVGVEFDESDWSEPALPTRADLDAVSPTRPVFARRVCGHIAVVNGAFLRLLTPSRFVDRESGRIVEDAVFEANRLARPPADAVAGAVDGAIARLHALGIAAVHDIVDPDSLDVYAAGLRASSRPLRIEAFVHAAADAFPEARAQIDAIDPGRLRAAGIKIFSDGSLGAHTAALHERYADADTTGDLLVDEPDLARELARCREQGIACAVHAIGDRAIAAVLDAADAAGAGGNTLRIEHAEILGDRELDRCARRRVALVMQPNFVRNWGGEGGLYQRRLGPARWRHHNRFASLLRAGVPFRFSSDVMPAGPLFGLRGATHHPVEEERIGPSEAIRRYLRGAGSAEAGGSGLGAGERADLVVLSGNPLLADADRLRVEATVVAGDVVYRAPVEPPKRYTKRGR